MPTKSAFRAAELMRTFGGNFAQCIGRAWLAADPKNKRILEDAFPELFQHYSDEMRWGQCPEEAAAA